MKNRSRSSGKMRKGALEALFAATKRRGIWFSREGTFAELYAGL